jgi:parallel beta-helix repeat protein
MNRLLSNRITLPVFVLAVSALLPFAGRTEARDISGTISTTLTIYEDSQLSGDVTCAVPLNPAGPTPCIAFGADHISLRLNGHTISGGFVPPAGCSVPSDPSFGVGILLLGRKDAEIEGPGLVQGFQRWGILLSSSSQVTIKNVTADHNCWSGIQTIGLSDSKLEKNVFTSNAGGSNGAFCGGT